MNRIELPNNITRMAASNIKYSLVNGGKNVLIRIGEDKYKKLVVEYISPTGVLCSDIETFIPWEDFSK